MCDPSPRIQCWVYIECSEPCEIKAVLCLTQPRRNQPQHWIWGPGGGLATHFYENGFFIARPGPHVYNKYDKEEEGEGKEEEEKDNDDDDDDDDNNDDDDDDDDDDDEEEEEEAVMMTRIWKTEGTMMRGWCQEHEDDVPPIKTESKHDSHEIK